MYTSILYINSAVVVLALHISVVKLCAHRYTVFALGNKTYEHYNATGKFVDKRLAELGAERMYPRGEGDDDGK